MPANCASCRHHVGAELGLDRRRECHASAPAFAREAQLPPYGRHPVFLAAWPLTLPTDGCGEWAAIPVAPVVPAPSVPAPAPAAPEAAPPKVPRKKAD
jgi:hypothetical protein